MAKVYFKPSEYFQPQARPIFKKIKAELIRLFPSADIQDMGSTAIPGLLTKGDLDINLRGDRQDFNQAVNYLKKHYKTIQLHNWNDGFASFEDESSYDLPVGIQVTVKNHKEDKFLKQRQLLESSPKLVNKYNKIKKSHHGKEMDEYRKAKWEFIEEFLEEK